MRRQHGTLYRWGDRTWRWACCLDHRRTRFSLRCRRDWNRLRSRRIPWCICGPWRSRILDLSLFNLYLPALARRGLARRSLTWSGLTWSSLVLIGRAVLAHGRLRLPAVRLRALFWFRGWVNHWKHANLRRIRGRIRNIPRHRKVVLVTRLTKTVMLYRSLRQRRRGWVQPTPAGACGGAREHP